MKEIAVKSLFENYQGLLIDAYGVLVDAQGVLPGAKDFVKALHDRKFPYLIVTNDASRLPERIAERLQGLGLPIETDKVVSSASLLGDYFRKHNLGGATTVVVGPRDASTYVSRAGGDPVAADDKRAKQASVVVVCDLPQGDNFGDLERVLEVCMAAVDSGRKLHLLLCNPDVIYPAGPGRYGFTSGAVMLLLEHAIASRFAAADRPQVVRLGKPFAEIFAAACTKLGTTKVAMLGDQLGTDVRGALDFGIDAVLVGTGLTRVTPGVRLEPEPQFFLPGVGAP